MGGFSQGGLIATRAALSFPDAPLGGVLALSTFFGSDEAPVAESQAELRVLVAHGEADNVVPLGEGQRVASSVRRLAPDAAVDFRAYRGMGHSTCDEQVRGFHRLPLPSIASHPRFLSPCLALPRLRPAAPCRRPLRASPRHHTPRARL